MLKNMLIVASILLAFNIFAFPVFAGCISDCRDEYESEVEDCQLMYGDDPDSYDDLQMCIEDAQSTYEYCEEECTS